MKTLKKFNKKQLAYSRAKVSMSYNILYRNWLFCILALIVFLTVSMTICNQFSLDTLVTVLSGTGYVATMAIIGNLPEISDKFSAPNQIGMKIWLIALDQVDMDEVFPTPNSDRELETVPMLAGEVAHYFDAIPDTIDEMGTATKGDIITEFNKTFAFVVAGNREKHLDFIEDYSGKGFVIIYQIGEDATKYVVGSAYKPMILQSSDRKGGGKEGRYITFTFQNKHWRQPLIYIGAIPTQAPDVVAAGATVLPVTAAYQYRLSDHSSVATIAAVSGIGSNDVGRVIEILAPETVTNAPEIADNNVFILKDGTTWTANPGSKISFKIFDSSTLTEVDGSRVQAS